MQVNVNLYGYIWYFLEILIYLINHEKILNIENIWFAFGIGIASGASSTSANRIIKKYLRKNKRGGKVIWIIAKLIKPN